MKKYKVFIIIFISSLIVLICLYLILLHLSNSHDSWIKKRKRMYCYETYHGPANPVLFVKDTTFIDSLKDFYKKVEKGDLKPVFNFPPLTVPLNERVYVLEYNQDSSIAKIQFYYRYKNMNWTAVGYVYSHTLHSNSAKK